MPDRCYTHPRCRRAHMTAPGCELLNRLITLEDAGHPNGMLGPFFGNLGRAAEGLARRGLVVPEVLDGPRLVRYRVTDIGRQVAGRLAPAPVRTSERGRLKRSVA